MRATPSAPRIHIHCLAWRFAPAIQRMQRTAVVAEKPAPPLPLIRGAVRLLFFAKIGLNMIRLQDNPRTLTWILTTIQIFSPLGIGLFTALPCIVGADSIYLEHITLVLNDRIFSFLLPFILLSILFITLNILPMLLKLNKLSLKIALVLVGFISFISVPIAGLSPLYAHMQAVSFCFSLHGGLAFFRPAYWVYFASIISVTLAIIISVRVYREVRAT